MLEFAEDAGRSFADQPAEQHPAVQFGQWTAGGLAEPLREFLEGEERRIVPAAHAALVRKRIEVVTDAALAEREHHRWRREWIVEGGVLWNEELRRCLLEQEPGVGAEYEVQLGLGQGHTRLRGDETAANLAPTCDRALKGSGMSHPHTKI